MMRIRALAVVVGGLLAVLALMATMSAPKAQAGSAAARLADQRLYDPHASVLLQTSGVSCTLGVTTTDALPNNQSFATAANLAPYTGLALAPGLPGDQVPPYEDYFILGDAIPGFQYLVQAVPDGIGNYNLGMVIYNSAFVPVYTDTNTLDGYQATFNGRFSSEGTFYFKIMQISNSCSGGTYHLSATGIGPTSTPTRTPTPTKTVGPTTTPYAGAPNADVFEPNNNFDQATTIGLNTKYANLNFVQWDVNSDEWDNDFFKVRVKPGMLITCHTFDLAPGTDTNLILYDNNLNGINGSDDVNRAAGDLSSSVTYYITYEGWLYALVGEGFSRPVSEQAKTGYSFECLIVNQSTPTIGPTPTFPPNVPTNTPIPTETPIPSPTLTPTPPFIKVNPLPTATPPGLPTQQVPVSLLTYYDANSNNKYDPGEGIVGISARVIDLTTGKLLAQGLTDTTGRVSFTVSAPGAVQLVVPYLNRSEIILPSGKAVTIRVSPSELPRSIP